MSAPAPPTIDEQIAPILEKHGVTRVDIAHGNPKKTPIRQARLEILILLTKAKIPARDIAKVLNTRPNHVRGKLRKLEREAGVKSAFPKADTSKRMKTKRPLPSDGPLPLMVGAPGERRDCIGEANCITALVKHKPAAQHASCPAACPSFQRPNHEQLLELALRRGPGFQA